MGVEKRQEVKAVLRPDAAEVLDEDVDLADPEEFAEAFPGGRQPDDVLNVVQFLVEDHPGEGQVVADLGLGLGDEGVPNEPRADNKGQHPSDSERCQRAQQELPS